MKRYDVPVSEATEEVLQAFVKRFEEEGEGSIEDDDAVYEAVPVSLRVHEGRLQWISIYCGQASEAAVRDFIARVNPQWRDVAPTAILTWNNIDEDE